MTANPDLYIADDGTLDTVVACDKCGWEGRYNPDFGSEAGIDPGREPYEDAELPAMRHREALDMATEDHDCAALDTGESTP